MRRDGARRTALLPTPGLWYGGGVRFPEDRPAMNATTEARFDAANLYREDSYTDRRVGQLRVLTPVKPDGTPDASRATLFVGQISVMTPMGTLPISFEVDAPDLAQAIEKFADAAKQAMDETMRELQQLRREAASQIVIPEPGAVPPAGGGGRIRMP
jgi:hypothetical protein